MCFKIITTEISFSQDEVQDCGKQNHREHVSVSGTAQLLVQSQWAATVGDNSDLCWAEVKPRHSQAANPVASAQGGCGHC